MDWWPVSCKTFILNSKSKVIWALYVSICLRSTEANRRDTKEYIYYTKYSIAVVYMNKNVLKLVQKMPINKSRNKWFYRNSKAIKMFPYEWNGRIDVRLCRKFWFIWWCGCRKEDRTSLNRNGSIKINEEQGRKIQIGYLEEPMHVNEWLCKRIQAATKWTDGEEKNEEYRFFLFPIHFPGNWSLAERR